MSKFFLRMATMMAEKPLRPFCYIKAKMKVITVALAVPSLAVSAQAKIGRTLGTDDVIF